MSQIQTVKETAPSLSELELAVRWNLSPRTLLTYRQRGKLEGFKAGVKTRYLLSEVEAYERDKKTVTQ